MLCIYTHFGCDTFYTIRLYIFTGMVKKKKKNRLSSEETNFFKDSSFFRCWIQHKYMRIFLFYIPVIVVWVLNLIMYILIWRKIKQMLGFVKSIWSYLFCIDNQKLVLQRKSRLLV